MDAEVMKERMDKLFSNRPRDNIEKLPEDIQKVIDDEVEETADRYLQWMDRISLKSMMCGAIGQAFFAGHNYAVEYGNLTAEMRKVS